MDTKKQVLLYRINNSVLAVFIGTVPVRCALLRMLTEAVETSAREARLRGTIIASAA